MNDCEGKCSSRTGQTALGHDISPALAEVIIMSIVKFEVSKSLFCNDKLFLVHIYIHMYKHIHTHIYGHQSSSLEMGFSL